jgi:hypothetical protein
MKPSILDSLHCFSVLFLAICMPYLPVCAQSGCTDPFAQNYNSGALTNDGSCTYPPTTFYPIFQADLPGSLNEISGLQQANNKLWALSDGGNGAFFYSLKPTNGNIEQEIKLKKADNRDWEALAIDSNNLYLGDFGNNANDRQDLGIYKVPLNAIGNDDTEEIEDGEYSFLPFVYVTQVDFSTLPTDSATFDSEAFLVHQGKIHLFGKNRLHQLCTHFILDEFTGQAIPQDTLEPKGLITAADISPDGKVIALLGYELQGIPKAFLWLLWDWPGDRFFEGNKRRIELGSALLVGQVESLAFTGQRNGLVANEKTAANGITFVEPSLWHFDISAFVNFPSSAINLDDLYVPVSPNPFSDQAVFDLNQIKSGMLTVSDCFGRVLWQRPISGQNAETWEAANVSSGIYLYQVRDNRGSLLQKGKLLKINK